MKIFLTHKVTQLQYFWSKYILNKKVSNWRPGNIKWTTPVQAQDVRIQSSKT